jgi:ATP-dependent exoDNAse (exonuclease V) alpha subunit
MGKSYCLDPLDEACNANGLRLIATSTDHSLVKQIEEKNPQIPASTIASLLWHWERGKNLPDRRTVFFVDEVSKLGTEWGARFLQIAHERGARVWLVGDHQFQAVGYGDTLRIVQRYEQGVDFTKTRRQRFDPTDRNPAWMREATEAMRRGEMLAGFQAYKDRGFVHETATEEEARAKTIELWRRIVADGRECQIETFTNATRVALDELVRPELRAMGKIGGDDVRLRTMDGVHYADGLVPYAVGEKVILRTSIREADMNNGDTAIVRGITGAVLHLEREDGKRVKIDTRTDEGSRDGPGRVRFARAHDRRDGTALRCQCLAAIGVHRRIPARTGISRGNKSRGFQSRI